MRLGALRGKTGVMAAVGVAGVCAATAIALVSASAGASPPAITLVSVAAAGGFSDGDSFLSGSARQVDSVGRYVVFASSSSDLAATPDTNGVQDIYLRDNVTATTQRVSVASGGGETDLGSYNPTVSVDGRYVAFASDATNLVTDDTNGLTDIFVRDMAAGVTVRVSVSLAGGDSSGASYSPAISADGHRIAFASDAPDLVADDTNGTTDVFVREFQPDLSSGSTVRVSTSIFGGDSDAASYSPVISGDGSTVAFVSDATNLVSDDTDGTTDVFAVGLAPGSVTTRVSVAAGGGDPDGPSFFSALSADGRFVAFASLATNIVTDDTNGQMDVFRFDRTDGSTVRVNVPSAGGEANGFAYSPSLSGDGSVVVFASDATNLVPGDGNSMADVFARDVSAGTTVRVSRSTTGGDADGQSFGPVVTDDGTQVAFASAASNLISDGGNGHYQVFQASRPVAAATAPEISLSATGSLPFSPVPLGDGSDSPVTITNTGTGDLHISGFTVTGPAFVLVTPPCPTPATLAPGTSCTITVHFAPSVAGPSLGILTITSDALASPTTLGLFGNGLQPAAAGGGYVLLPGAPPKTKLIEQYRERFEFAFRMPRSGIVKGKQITYRYFAGGSFWVVRSSAVAVLRPGIDGGGCPIESFGGPAEVRRLSPAGTELPPEPGSYWVSLTVSDCGGVPGSVPVSGVGFDRVAIEVLAGGEFGSPVHVLGGTPGVRLPIASGNIGVRIVDITAPAVPS